MNAVIDVDIQWALSEAEHSQQNDVPSAIRHSLTDELIIETVALVLKEHHTGHGELTVRFVDAAESQQLNLAYRDKDKPTNVLSFPSDLPDFIDSPFIGDLVICHAIVAQEAAAQNKDILAHYQHLIIHGVLHLLGYDHISPDEADIMENHEILLLSKLGIDDPYQVD